MREAVLEGECSRCNGCFNAGGMLPSVEKDVMLDTGNEPWILKERWGGIRISVLEKDLFQGVGCGINRRFHTWKQGEIRASTRTL